MSYQSGYDTAGCFIRLDFFGRRKPKCDPRYGWKQGARGKCERAAKQDNPEESYGTSVLLTEGDKDGIENFVGGSKSIDNYQSFGRTREQAVTYARDASRLMTQQKDGANFNKEVEEMNRFATAREKGDKSVVNKYGTNSFVSSSEAKWIDGMGGPESVGGLSTSKAVDYLKDVYMTRPEFSSNPNQELAKVNKHYFGK